MLKKNTPQACVFNHGQPHAPGFEGAAPLWLNMDFLNVQPYDTVDDVLNIPANFHLDSVLGGSHQVVVPTTFSLFKVSLYDVDRQVYLMNLPAIGDLVLGRAPGFMIQSVPYPFPADGGQCFIRVTNLSGLACNFEVALRGFVGGES